MSDPYVLWDVPPEVCGRIGKVIKITIPIVIMERKNDEHYECDAVYMILLDGQT